MLQKLSGENLKYVRLIIRAIKDKVVSDPVLIAAWILAFVSMIFVHPDAQYAGYIDWRSLGILWGLMIVIRGFKENTLFEKAGDLMLQRVSRGWQLAAVPVFMCFFRVC